MTKKKVKGTLPSKPSELIRVALKDLAAVEKMKNEYEIDMGEWHSGRNESRDKCAVCLAGSVLVQSLGFRENEDVAPEDFPKAIEHKLLAIDSFRMGEIEQAFDQLGRRLPVLLAPTVLTTPYSDNPAEFKKEMKQLADGLAALGQ